MENVNVNSGLTQKITEKDNNSSLTPKNNDEIKFIVNTNFNDADYLECSAYRNGIFDYKLKVLKNERNKNFIAGDCVKTLIKEHNILSPDGFAISIDNFPTKDLAFEFYEKWKNSFSKQGYYSSNKGRILISDLDLYIEHYEITIDADEQKKTVDTAI